MLSDILWRVQGAGLIVGQVTFPSAVIVLRLYTRVHLSELEHEAG